MHTTIIITLQSSEMNMKILAVVFYKWNQMWQQANWIKTQCKPIHKKKHVSSPKMSIVTIIEKMATFKVIANWVRNFCTLKNKHNLTLCQSRLHTASETFVRHKQIWIRFEFLRFCIYRKHFERKVWGIWKNVMCDDLYTCTHWLWMPFCFHF